MIYKQTKIKKFKKNKTKSNIFLNQLCLSKWILCISFLFYIILLFINIINLYVT